MQVYLANVRSAYVTESAIKQDERWRIRLYPALISQTDSDESLNVVGHNTTSSQGELTQDDHCTSSLSARQWTVGTYDTRLRELKQREKTAYYIHAIAWRRRRDELVHCP